MKAVRIHQYGGPEVLAYEDAPVPQPAAGQLLVEIRAVGVNPVDVSIRENRFPTPRELPKIIGSDGAGVVTQLGEGVTKVAVGDEVLFTGLGVGMEGSYAEYAVITETQTVIKPPPLSFEQAAAIALVFPTAYYALVTRAKLQAGETVLVQGGAGGIGSAALQLAKSLGAGVLITTVSREEDVAPLLDLGADSVLRRTSSDVPAEVKRLTDGKGVDVIIEPALAENMATDLAALAKGGRIIAVGAGA
jgi:NADPH:quinone reductase